MNIKMKICIIYGSTSSSTEQAALKIKKNLEVSYEVNLYNIYKHDISIVKGYKSIIIGCPTWDIGLLQEDWRTTFPNIDKINFKDKKVAYFGAGDQFVYSETFLDALGTLEKKISSLGGKTIGYCSSKDYKFRNSKALRGEKFVGLGFDNDNEPEKTERRINEWCKILRKELDHP
jgi:flavodoxin I